MTTPAEVNKALAAAGLKVEIIRNQMGGVYYYFIGDGFDKVETLYSYSLKGYTTAEIVEHVREGLAIHHD